ncbi:gfo/Idh/MocA family oxidoreductase [Sphingomonas histidinilytica]|nr:gfo/Idh/MocA family oxidoreductase [Rhizorhabdus histidinilytica]
MMPSLRFAVIGRGRMAATMRALVGDVGEDKADAVYIAGRNRDHAARSLAALADGKAVLCEKPATMGVAEAEAVVAESRRTGLLYMEAVATPFLPAVAAALAAVRSGRIGAPARVEASFGYRVRRADHPRLFEADGGVLADRAVYPLMLALIALGPVRGMRCSVDRDAAGIDVAARLTLDHAGGGVSDLAVSFVERLDNSLRIVGDGGAVEVQPPLLTAQRLRFTGPGRAAPSPLWRHARQNPLVRRLGDLGSRGSARWHPFGASPYAHEIEHFVALHRAGAIESPVISHARTVEVARLVEQARRL